MEYFAPSDLKTILHSRRANIFYLEKCRVMAKDGRVVYLTEDKNNNNYWNIPIANTTVVLLGIGTSITQAAVRMMASAGVLIGFSGNGGSPLIAGNEVEWLCPQSEYRPTEYMQGWMGFWFDEEKRLAAAKSFQKARIAFLQNIWSKDRDLKAEGFFADDYNIEFALKSCLNEIDNAKKPGDLLQKEALLTKQLYKNAAKITKLSNFTRDRESSDLANIFLNHGNYLAYGLGATTLWVLGISHSFAVMHGKTRRGALVFDVADLIKDAIILPWSFICAKEKANEKEFRQQILQKFTEYKALDFMFEVVKEQAIKNINFNPEQL
jgi:CRISPR-associated protein Cas1